MFRYLVVDDHAILRRGLIEIIEETTDQEVIIDEASCGYEALQKIQAVDYDLIFLDISMPGRSGLEILKTIKIEKPDLPVLILSMYPEEQFALRALKAGASGYLTKESAPDELKNAINKIIAGGNYITPAVSDMLVNDASKFVASQEASHTQLSDREYSVFLLIATGASLKDISQKLALSDKTISTYRTRILTKMGLKNNAQIIAYSIKYNLT